MEAFRDQIREEQRVTGVRVIRPQQVLRFLDPDLRSACCLGSCPIEPESEVNAT
jgi:hypothetical protein